MHQKYLSKNPPCLADGDFMGIFLGEELGYLNLLVKEGLERLEKVIISVNLINYISEELRGNVEVIDLTGLQILENILRDYKNKKGTNDTVTKYTGSRYLLDAELLFDSTSDLHRREILDRVLRSMMKGELSIGVVHFDMASVTIAQLSSYPRIYINGRVATNKFFVLPSQSMKKGSELSLIYEDESLSTIEFSSDGETFPTGVPDMLESIIESMGVGIVVGDRYGNMILFNKASQEMMGLPPSPLPYAERIRRFGNFLPDKETPFPFELLPLSRAISGENFDNELIFVKNQNKPNGAWIKATGRGVHNSEGDLIGGVLVSRDITEEKKLQEENEYLEQNLVQNQKLESLGVLAGGIAHDFNNLLVGVLGNASIVLQQGGVSEVLRPRIEQIQQAGFQLSDLTKQLLIYAGINPNSEYQVFDVNNLVKSMSGLVEAAVSKKIQLHIDLEQESLLIKGDEVQIRQVLLNLAINAADAYGPQGGELWIKTWHKNVSENIIKRSFYSAAEVEGYYVGFEVEDIAGGIDESLITKVFDPFFSTKGMGRGLGLSAVLGIVKAHKGFLELEVQKGLGTVFRVWFPASNDCAFKKAQITKGCRSNLLDKKVLLIDDEELVLDVADSILSYNGLIPLKASSGLSGLEMLENEQDDLSLIILDMNMPDMNGEDVYREIRKVSFNLPIIISSGFSKELCSLEKFNDDNCYFLEKPYSVEKLLEVVSQVLS